MMDTEKLDFLKGELVSHFKRPYRYAIDTEAIIDADGKEVIKLEAGQYLWDKCVSEARYELQVAIGALIASALTEELTD